MSALDDLIATFTARQHGLIARWQADDAGVPAWALQRRIEAGALVVVHPGVHRLRGVPYTQELRWLAAVLAAGPGARLSHRAAATLHGFGVRVARPEITIPHGRECNLGEITVHRTRRLADLTVVNRIPVTSKPRTMLDLGAVVPGSAFREILEGAVTSGLVSVESLLAVLDRRGGCGVEGTVALRTGLASGLVDEKIQRRLELLVARLIGRARVPAPVRQHELVCDDGRRVLLDNAWPDRRIAIEAEGLRWHGTSSRARRTRERARSITRTGWSLYAYGWSDATETPDDTVSEIEAVLWAGSRRVTRRDPAQSDGTAA